MIKTAEGLYRSNLQPNNAINYINNLVNIKALTDIILANADYDKVQALNSETFWQSRCAN